MHLTWSRPLFAPFLPYKFTSSSRCISKPSDSLNSSWDLVNPQMWTRHNVLEWIGFHVEDSRFDASLLNMNCCDMDGITLCTMSKETLMSMFGSMLGERLHHSLETQKARYGELQKRNLFEEAFEVLVLECINTLDLFVSTATDLSETSPRGTHLWEFIRDILIHPEKNHGLMKWEDRRDGVFKFLKSEAVAQLWGQKKKNSSMTYEKLSRAMRYYYKREILERVDGRRLVYKFGKNSTGWRIEETGY
uniref:E74-like factor 3 (ets domain transcription factor, epithelial-specific ) n=1 Tax=Cyprinus carpio TaxID=7962 RepID=A0A8C1NS92_CYPCA